MTLLVRDERDIVERASRLPLRGGRRRGDRHRPRVDGRDRGDPRPATRASGRVRVLREPEGPFRQREWVTRMARLAATEHGADWVINGDADEFWWPRGGSLQEVLAAVPRRYGIAQSFVRHFVPVRGRRAAVPRADDLPAQPDGADQRPCQPVAAVPEGRPPRVARDRARRGRARRPLATSSSPCAAGIRSSASTSPFARRRRSSGRGVPGATRSRSSTPPRRCRGRRGRRTTRSSTRPRRAAQPTRTTRSLAIAPDDVETGVAAGLLAEDTRVRDAIRARCATAAPRASRGRRRSTPPRSRSRRPCSAEADVVRTQRWLDDLERRVAAVERRAPVPRRAGAPAPAPPRTMRIVAHAPRPRRGGRRRGEPRAPPRARRRPRDRHRPPLERRDDRDPRAVRAATAG